MTRGTAHLVRLGIAVGCLMLGASTLGSSRPLARQMNDGQPIASARRTTNPPMTVTLALATVTGDLAYFAGQYVRIPAARVRDVISPRLFTVEPVATPHSYMRNDGRALVVLSAPAPGITKDLVVEIIGRPWTFAGAQTRLGTAWIDELKGDRHQFERKPIIEADVVRTPGGEALFPSSTAPPAE